MMKPSLLLLLSALTAPAIQTRTAPPQGGGEVFIAGTRYRFEPVSLMASTTRVDGNQALQLKGRLVPDDAAAALDVELVTLGPRTIYQMELVRHEGKVEKLRWGANLKTRMEVVAPEHPGEGDQATFKVEGPLVGMEDGKAKHTSWSGSFWAAFTVELVP